MNKNQEKQDEEGFLPGMNHTSSPLVMHHTGWPIKNGTAYFPQYVDAMTSISVCGNFS